MVKTVVLTEALNQKLDAGSIAMEFERLQYVLGKNPISFGFMYLLLWQ